MPSETPGPCTVTGTPAARALRGILRLPSRRVTVPSESIPPSRPAGPPGPGRHSDPTGRAQPKPKANWIRLSASLEPPPLWSRTPQPAPCLPMDSGPPGRRAPTRTPRPRRRVTVAAAAVAVARRAIPSMYLANFTRWGLVSKARAASALPVWHLCAYWHSGQRVALRCSAQLDRGASESSQSPSLLCQLDSRHLVAATASTASSAAPAVMCSGVTVSVTVAPSRKEPC